MMLVSSTAPRVRVRRIGRISVNSTSACPRLHLSIFFRNSMTTGDLFNSRSIGIRRSKRFILVDGANGHLHPLRSQRPKKSAEEILCGTSGYAPGIRITGDALVVLKNRTWRYSRRNKIIAKNLLNRIHASGGITRDLALSCGHVSRGFVEGML